MNKQFEKSLAANEELVINVQAPVTSIYLYSTDNFQATFYSSETGSSYSAILTGNSNANHDIQYDINRRPDGNSVMTQVLKGTSGYANTNPICINVGCVNKAKVKPNAACVCVVWEDWS